MLLLLLPLITAAQNYSNHAQITQRLKSLESNHRALVKLQSIAKTTGGKDIWMLEIGSGDRDKNPAIVVVGGVEGSHLLGQELALGFAEKLLAAAQQDSIKRILASTAFYVFPSMSPDAAEQYFARLKYERSANATPTDDDRDGKVNEDGFDDLNNDGLITMMRVEDPTGSWRTHPADPRIMVQANKEKGESGKYLMFTEGTDNDKDGQFNEDGEGGIHFNKSLTFDPPYFQAGAGEHPVSEPENRALLDMLHEKFNVFAVVTFGPANNLTDPLKFDASRTRQRVITGILNGDAKVNRMVSDMYKQAVKNKDASAAAGTQGDFFQWAYFHYGRQSYSTPGWWMPKFEVPKDSASAAKYKPNEDKNVEVDFLRWAESQNIDAFVNWTKVNHPDFPGKNVEVGGFKPFVKANPPYSMVPKLVDDHTKFLLSMASRKPEIDIVNLKTESLGDGVSRVTFSIQNKGYFPAVADVARNNYWVKLVKITLNTASGQQLISGNKITLLNNLEAGESQEYSYLIRGKGKVSVEAGAPQMGFKKLELNL
ncbi:MAG TPA: M14 family metallopeptidase [Cyclobacteriaceae bacterium]|nr:M14 family metallopeptidase [Cyclobacteriaceae bacterium]